MMEGGEWEDGGGEWEDGGGEWEGECCTLAII